MILNGFRCDSCTKEHLVDQDIDMKRWLPLLPITWFMVSRAPVNKNDDLKPCVFCSATCVITHMKKLEAIQ